ncbi:preprotein translocase subunit SecA [Candidatus Microgenomates bacterium]|nr:MAG: preprotein translocase subunit SecA [Candidatus Microgenomates bacterium]
MIQIISRIIDLNKRELDRLQKQVKRINELEGKMKKLKDIDFPKKTEEFKKRLKKEKLEDLIPEAFALTREASVRVLGQRQHDVQLIAGVALFEGKIVEQKTGEGKTLTAAAPLYLRALSGKGVHLVTVNDYLARIGAGWNAPVYKFLGLTTGVIAQEQKSYIYDEEYDDTSHGDERLAHLKPAPRKEAYSADITYGTNNEFGFDYLRDNMVPSLERMVQRGHNFAIVDEVDQVLIDEARTPLIISAPDSDPTEKYYRFAQMIDKLNSDTDYTIDEKSKSATLTEHGVARVEKILGLTNLYEEDYDAIHHIENALRARALYLNDREYIVKDGQVVIVDEFTGRLMPGRRWSDGLHQAVEAKEGVPIQQESKTLATISFQNYFRMYSTLSGMTGTAATEADEFKKIYNLEVIVVPTNKPIVRKDNSDSVYKTVRGKYSALVGDIADRHRKGQPVLVGTTSVEKNEIISQLLKHKKIPHNMLNAKNHEKEASIIADAGRPGAVTVATNMAGRGVDIILGGSVPDKPDNISFEKFNKSKEYKEWEVRHEKVVASGGLHVIGTERHESRRIDNQLRGRAGRQGDPGSSRFYLSLEDDLMRIFGGEQIGRLMDRLKMPEDQPIENPLVSKAIEQSQVKVEGFHFDQRKRLVEYDDVANQQREIVYSLRKRVLSSDNLKDEVVDRLMGVAQALVGQSWIEGEESVNAEQLAIGFSDIVPFDNESRKKIEKEISGVQEREKLKEYLGDLIKKIHASREKDIGEQTMREIEKYAYLGAIDHLWVDHIDHIDGLREGVMLRAYGQRDPLVEFKNEAYTLFEKLLANVDDELGKRIFRIQVARPQVEIPLEKARTNIDTGDNTGLIDESADAVAATGEPAFVKKTTRPSNKIGRNDPCWCGSGKKWKKCHYPQAR